MKVKVKGINRNVKLQQNWRKSNCEIFKAKYKYKWKWKWKWKKNKALAKRSNKFGQTIDEVYLSSNMFYCLATSQNNARQTLCSANCACEAMFVAWPNGQKFCLTSKFHMFDKQYFIIWPGSYTKVKINVKVAAKVKVKFKVKVTRKIK